MSRGQVGLSRWNVQERLESLRSLAKTDAAIKIVREADRWLADYAATDAMPTDTGAKTHERNLRRQALRWNYPSMAALEREIFGENITSKFGKLSRRRIYSDGYAEEITDVGDKDIL